MMRVNVFVAPTDDGKFRAEMNTPFSLSAEGATKEEAIDRLRRLAKQKAFNGELVEIELPLNAPSNPWVKYAGIWKDDPHFDEFVEAIQEYRREVDQINLPLTEY